MGDEATRSPAPPLVDALSAAWSDSHVRNVAHSQAALNANITQWLEAFEAEHAGVIAGVMQRVLDMGILPAPVHEMISSIANPVHQTQVILGLFSVGAIVREFVSAVIAPYVQDAANAAWSSDPTAPLSPAEAAVGVVKGHMDEGTAIDEAKRSGIDPERFLVMLLNTGEPPGLQQLQEALRRGIIDTGTFDKGVRQSRVRNEWTDTLIALRYAPVAAGEVLNAAVQGHLDPADARHRIDIAGIDPANFDWLYETHGRPPGTMELLHLYNRGEVSLAVVEQAIRESDIKNKYIPELVKLARQIPPQRTVVSAIRQGVLSTADGITKLRELGYNAQDAAMLAAEATATKHQRSRDLSEAQAVQLYSEGFITGDALRTMLTTLGYDSTEIGYLIALADHQRHWRFQQSAINAVHSRFVAHKIDSAQASNALDELGVLHTARDDLIALWQHERKAHVATLTRADLKAAHSKKLITTAEWEKRLANMGYAEDDIHIIVGLAT